MFGWVDRTKRDETSPLLKVFRSETYYVTVSSQKRMWTSSSPKNERTDSSHFNAMKSIFSSSVSSPTRLMGATLFLTVGPKLVEAELKIAANGVVVVEGHELIRGELVGSQVG